jgi:hypothetical protein
MKKQVLSEQFRRMQKLAGILTEQEIAQPDIKRENLITFIRFQNGLIFEVGSEDESDEGIIIRINEYQNGYEVMGYGNGEGYSRYYSPDGNVMDEDDLLQELKEEADSTYTIKLLVKRVYYDVETGEYAASPYQWYDRSELRDADVLRFTSGEELRQTQYEDDMEAAMEAARNFPDLFRVVSK